MNSVKNQHKNNTIVSNFPKKKYNMTTIKVFKTPQNNTNLERIYKNITSKISVVLS